MTCTGFQPVTDPSGRPVPFLFIKVTIVHWTLQNRFAHLDISLQYRLRRSCNKIFGPGKKIGPADHFQ